MDDKPLAKGTVLLWPDKEKGNNFVGQPTGEVENGKYKVMTNGKAGAPAGWYKATVTGGETPDSTKPLETKNLVESRFRDAGKTPLKLEVVASPAAGAYDLLVSAKK